MAVIFSRFLQFLLMLTALIYHFNIFKAQWLLYAPPGLKKT